jgi:hypothetical protein
MKISELYGKRVESEDKLTNGFIMGVRHDGGKIRFLHCFDNDDKEFFIDVSDLTQRDGQLIFKKTARVEKSCLSIRLGSPIYSDKGKFLGRLTDAECTNFTIKSAFADNKKYPAKRVIFGDAIIVKSRNSNISRDQSNLSLAAKDMFIANICS